MFGIAIFGLHVFGVPSTTLGRADWIDICPTNTMWNDIDPQQIQHVRCNDAP